MFTARLLNRNEIDEKRWNAFVTDSPQQSLYAASWYLDQVCPNWQAVIVTAEEQWEAILPLPSRQKYGAEYSLQPYFTQYLGVLFKPEAPAKNRVHQHTKNVLTALIKGIPASIRLFEHSFHPSVDYLLPFFWAGFKARPRYTYWLDLEPGYKAVRSRFTKSIKSDLKRAEKEGFVCDPDAAISELSDLLQKRQLISVEEAQQLHRLWEAVIAEKKGAVVAARTPEGELKSIAAFLFDQTRVVYLLSASTEGPQKGANSLLVDWGIQNAHEKGLRYFDFEGSMLEPVEHYFRAFNPEIKTYFWLEWNRLPFLLRMGYAWKNR